MECRKAFDIDLAGFLAEPRSASFDAFRTHYPTCAACASEVRAWTELHEALGGESHPTAAELAGYASLAPERQGAIDRHSSRCAACREELRLLDAFDPATLREAAVVREPEPDRVGFMEALARLFWHPAFAYGLAIVVVVPLLWRTQGPGRDGVELAFEREARFETAQRDDATAVAKSAPRQRVAPPPAIDDEATRRVREARSGAAGEEAPAEADRVAQLRASTPAPPTEPEALAPATRSKPEAIASVVRSEAEGEAAEREPLTDFDAERSPVAIEVAEAAVEVAAPELQNARTDEAVGDTGDSNLMADAGDSKAEADAARTGPSAFAAAGSARKRQAAAPIAGAMADATLASELADGQALLPALLPVVLETAPARVSILVPVEPGERRRVSLALFAPDGVQLLDHATVAMSERAEISLDVERDLLVPGAHRVLLVDGEHRASHLLRVLAKQPEASGR